MQPGAYPGDVPTIWPLRDDGSGQPYATPTGQDGDTYRRIPESFWASLLPEGELTGAGLVMYLAALRTVGARRSAENLTFSRNYVAETFGLGDSTRKAGLRNLTELLVLDAETRVADDAGDSLRRRRLRTVYELLDPYLSPPPTVTSSSNQSASRATLLVPSVQHEDDGDLQ